MATPYESEISAEFPFVLHSTDILGSQMRYVDTQPNETSQPTALFLHGNGTSSFLWRNIVPHVSPVIRCVAPDLIGMGHSSRPDHLSYRFTDHYTFLSTFINKVIPTGPIVLIVHDWGSALGLHWAWQQAELSQPHASPRVMGVCLMEFVRPFATWQDFGLPEKLEQAFRAFRTRDIGRKLIVDDNAFVKTSIPGGQFRTLANAELEYYERPYQDPKAREVLYVWTNEIPIEQRPSDVYDIATRYHDWLLQTDLPKLLFWATPGAIITPEKARWYSRSLKNVDTINLGEGLHNLQEDYPHAIGMELFNWITKISKLALELRLEGKSTAE